MLKVTLKVEDKKIKLELFSTHDPVGILALLSWC